MHYPRIALRLLPGLLLAVTLVGCDSGGGGGGGGLGDDVTLKVEGSSGTSVSWTPSFAYGTGDEVCISATVGLGTGGTVPIDETITPNPEGSCPPDSTDASNFDGVQVNVTLSGSEDLTVQLISNGNEIDETTEPSRMDSSQTGTVTTYTVEGGDFPNF